MLKDGYSFCENKQSLLSTSRCNDQVHFMMPRLRSIINVSQYSHI